MKKLSVVFAAGALVALSSVLVGATAGHAGVRGRSGTIAFRLPGSSWRSGWCARTGRGVCFSLRVRP
jgi:hypothetical protein